MAEAKASTSKSIMKWSDEHDVLFLREMRSSNVFNFKKESVARGEEWEAITDLILNQTKSLKFNLKDKRGVRERWVLLRRKYKNKMSYEEKASGIAVDDMTEKDTLIEELIEIENLCESTAGNVTKSKKFEQSKAEEARRSAMETMGQTRKRKKSELMDDIEDEDEDELEVKPKKQKKRCAQPLVQFLQEKESEDRELREAELEMKKKEQEMQNNLMKSMLDVIKNLLSKD